MFGPIQFGGLASGLDTAAIIDALLGVAKVPINLLEEDKKTEQSKLDLLGKLDKLVDTLRDKAQSLSTKGGFLAYKGTVSVENALALSVTENAVAGAHSITVNSLASSDRYAFTGVADASTTQLGAGNITFTYDGTAYDVAVSAGSSTLTQVAAAINSAADGAVTAMVVNTGTASAPSHQLVLSGDDTGADFSIDALTVTGSLATTLVAPAAAEDYHITTASNAEIVLDGLTIQRSTNTFGDVLAGVEFTVQAVDLTSPQSFTFTVEPDTEVIKTQLQELVDAYNAVIDFVNTQSTYDEEAGPGGDLFGDSVLSSVQNIVRGALFNVDISTVLSDTTGYSTLGLVGIDLGTDGRLTIDETTLDEKLSGDLDAFMDLFVDTDGFDNGTAVENTPGYYADLTADSGVFATLYRAIDQAVKSVKVQNDPGTTDDDVSLDGLFARRKKTFQSNIERMSDQIDVLEKRLEDYEVSLVQRFTALEELMAGLNAQSSYLSSLGVTQ